MNIQEIKEKIRQNPKISIISLVVFLLVLILIIVLAVTLSGSKDDEKVDKNDPIELNSEFFKNSILKKIKTKKLSLKTEIKVFNIEKGDGKYKKELINVIKGVYDHKTKTERQYLEYYEDGIKTSDEDLLTLDNVSETYQINLNKKTCTSISQSEQETAINFYLQRWFSKEIADQYDFLQIMLSPNYILFYMIDKRNLHTKYELTCRKQENEKNKNELMKCELTHKENTKIDLYFENVDKETMFPKKLEVYERKSAEDAWVQSKELEYVDFKVQSDGDLPSDFDNLPVGLLCNRLYKYKYDKLYFTFTPDFEFDYDLNLTYTDKKTKKPVSKKYSSSIHASISTYNTFLWQLELHASDGINEETNKRMRTFYDNSVQMYYDFYPEADGTGACHRHSYRGSKNKINWFYFQDIFVKDPLKFDMANEEYSFLGIHKVDGIDSKVFERAIAFDDVKNNDELNYDNSHSKNINNITSSYLIASYYYDKDKKRFDFDEKTPFKMEFRLKGDDEKTEVGKLTIDIKKFNRFIESREKTFGSFSNCIKATGYDQVTIEYTADSKIVEKTTNKEQFKRALRDKLNSIISQLRISEMNVKVGKTVGAITSVFVQFKLQDQLDSESHFDINVDKEFAGHKFDDHDIVKDVTAEQCARKCFEYGDCAAYSHDQSDFICKRFSIDDFDHLLSALERKNKKFDFSAHFKMIDKKGCKLGTRFALYYFPKHASNKELDWAIENEINQLRLNLNIIDDEKLTHLFEAKDVKIERMESAR